MKAKLMKLVLTAILVVSLFFIAIQTSSSGEYDPWIDSNDDGEIDIFDAINLAAAFGTSGTPINKTELLLELQARIDALNATVTDLVNQIGGCSEGVVNIKDVYGWTTNGVLGTVTLDFDNPFNSADYYLFTRVILAGDFDPGSGLIPAGTPVDVRNVVKTVANFTAEVWYGEDLLKGAYVDIFYIAIEMGTTMGTQAVEGGKYDGKVMMNKVQTDPGGVVTIDFENPFTATDKPEMIVSVVLRAASDGLAEGAAIKAVEDIKGSAGNWTGFDLTVSKYSGGSISNNAMVFVTWIAIGAQEQSQSAKRVVAGQVTGAPPNLDNITMPVSLPGANSSNTIVVASGFKVEGSVTTPLAVQGTVQSQSTISFQVWDINGDSYNPAAWDAVGISYTVIDR